MKCRKTRNCCWMGMVLAFVLAQIPLHSIACVHAAEKGNRDLVEASSQLEFARPKDRAGSMRALVLHLGLGKGSVIADIGAGGGRDTWVFAEMVGDTGTVFAEEIEEDKVKSLKSQADEKGLSQVHAVLGCSDDPCLPPDSVDMVYMNRVYHHFSQPREMLRGFWRSLRPGGYLVIADQRRGTLQDWVPRERRATKHFWIAETTVVREAREEGFAFTACVEQLWHEKKGFVLVFQRPQGRERPGCDPDPFLSLPVDTCSRLFLPLGSPYQRPVFIALGQARQLMGPILEKSSGQGLEIVLEEWATQKEERQTLPPNVSLPSVLTENGHAELGSEPIDAVFFLDTYHLLFHGKALLDTIYKHLSPDGCIYVLDRKAEELQPRREASHRREIHPKIVQQEMTEAGFFLRFRAPRPARDRFLLVFGKS